MPIRALATRDLNAEMRPGEARPVVIKLGGSLAFSPHLASWLEASTRGGLGVVLVPGGGPFADTVRQAQERWHFGDRLAHVMAIHAMEQFGRMLTGLVEGLVPAETPQALANTLSAGRTALWMPGHMTLDCRDIPASWAVTSDSLAAWLAAQIDADRLVLVKSAALSPGNQGVQALVGAGILDGAFAEFITTANFATSCVGADTSNHTFEALRRGELPGTPVMAEQLA